MLWLAAAYATKGSAGRHHGGPHRRAPDGAGRATAFALFGLLRLANDLFFVARRQGNAGEHFGFVPRRNPTRVVRFASHGCFPSSNPAYPLGSRIADLVALRSPLRETRSLLTRRANAGGSSDEPFPFRREQPQDGCDQGQGPATTCWCREEW
jgi:hypothetical protein